MAEFSGAQWCARFPTSAKLDDLLPDFADSCRAFLSALKKADATVTIAATYRPVERAYLMHWCCMIGGSGQDPAKAPAMKGVNIDWKHGGSIQKAREAARAMMAGYQIKFPAALVRRHHQRPGNALALDRLWTSERIGQNHFALGVGFGTNLRALGHAGGTLHRVRDRHRWRGAGLRRRHLRDWIRRRSRGVGPHRLHRRRRPEADRQMA